MTIRFSHLALLCAVAASLCLTAGCGKRTATPPPTEVKARLEAAAKGEANPGNFGPEAGSRAN